MRVGYSFVESAPTSSSPLTRSDRALALGAALLLLVGSVGWMIHRRQVDLEVYRTGALHAFSASLYHVSTSVGSGAPLPFTYPPFAALLLWPLRFGRSGLVQVLWALLGALCLWVSLRVVLEWTPPTRRPRWWWALVLAGAGVLVNPILQTFAFGQINLLVMALVLVDLGGVLTWGSRSLPRGVLIGIAAAVKLVPLIWIAYFVVTRQRRGALVASASFVGSVLLSGLLNFGGSKEYWLHDVVAQSRIGVVSFVSNQSLQGLLDRVSHRTLSSLLVDSISGVVLVAGLLLARRLHERAERTAALWTIAATGLLVSPVSWVHHYVWAWPALVWAFAQGSTRTRVGAGLLTGIFVVAPMWWVPHGAPFDLRDSPVTALAANSFALVALGVLVVTAWSTSPRRGGVSTILD